MGKALTFFARGLRVHVARVTAPVHCALIAYCTVTDYCKLGTVKSRNISVICVHMLTTLRRYACLLSSVTAKPALCAHPKTVANANGLESCHHASSHCRDQSPADHKYHDRTTQQRQRRSIAVYTYGRLLVRATRWATRCCPCSPTR